MFHSFHFRVTLDKFQVCLLWQHRRKISEGLYSPAPQPEGHNRDLDPGFEEDPDIFMVLENGVFYQASYDGTEVPIIADYLGLLPASHVSNQEIFHPK